MTGATAVGREALTTSASPAAELEPGDALFVGLGASAVAWYRCALPATFMGHDWIGLVGQPPQVSYKTGMVKGQTILPEWKSYKVVVLQQPKGPRWLKVIRELQASGIVVLFEVDDYLHGIRKLAHHDFVEFFNKAALRDWELCMGACDGMIVSTEALAKRYRRFNRRIYVCENGIDVGRYQLTRPPRDTITVGWAGGTGHRKVVAEWMRELARVMHERPDVNFVSVGQPFADPFIREFGPLRATSVPFTMVDNYPAAMAGFDIALAPAGGDAFFQCKSDLRWVEAAALAIPTIADPRVYPKIRDGETGFHARDGRYAMTVLRRLLDDPDLRARVGDRAREEVCAARDMRYAAHQWADVFRDVTATASI